MSDIYAIKRGNTAVCDLATNRRMTPTYYHTLVFFQFIFCFEHDEKRKLEHCIAEYALHSQRNEMRC